MALSEGQLHGAWVHSHEEDVKGEKVFRRPTYRFPRARGRAAIALNSDGTYVERFPGPADVPEEARGRWRLEGDGIILRPEGGGAGQSYKVTSQQGDRLTLRPRDD